MEEARPTIQSYRTVHQIEPQTIAYALADSLAGTAALILGRRRDWGDHDGDVFALPGVSAWIDCELARVDDAGDHWIVFGRVTSLSADNGHPGPLVFCRGTFGQFIAVSRNGRPEEADVPRSWWW